MLNGLVFNQCKFKVMNLRSTLKETHGKKVPKDVFALIKCIGKAVTPERFLKYL